LLQIQVKQFLFYQPVPLVVFQNTEHIVYVIAVIVVDFCIRWRSKCLRIGEKGTEQQCYCKQLLFHICSFDLKKLITNIKKIPSLIHA